MLGSPDTLPIRGGIAVFSLLGSLAFAAPGSPDTSFSGDGVFQTPFGTSVGPGVGGVAIQDDGKILVAGSSWNDSQGKYDLMVMRLNENGTLDTGYDGDGFLVVNVSTSSATITDIKPVPGGGFLVSGRLGTQYFFATKLTANGALDTTYGSGGTASLNVGTGNNHSSGSAVAADGSVVVAGQVAIGNSPRTGLVRFTSAGQPDTTFNLTGLTDPAVAVESWFSAVAFSGTDIIAVGYTRPGSRKDFLVAKYTSTGALDPSFDSDGLVSTDLGDSESLNAVAVQSDGKIVAGGSLYNGTDDDFAIVRYLSGGGLDPDFGTNGVASMDINGSWDGVKDIVIQADGKILASGTANNGNDDDFAVVRFNSDGSPDSTFGNGGMVIVPIGSLWDTPEGMTLDDDGRIVVAGTVATNSVGEIGAIRLIGGDPEVVVVPTRKPDTRVGAGPGVATGNNVYNASGQGQTETVQIVKLKSKTMQIGIQNDGTAVDSFKLKGTPGNNHFDVVYKKGATDVTAKVKAGTYQTAKLAPGAIETLKVVIKAKKTAGGKTLSLKQTSTSVAKPTAADTAVIKVKGKAK